MNVYVLKVGSPHGDHGHERIMHIYSNHGSAEMDLDRLERCAEDPERPEYGSRFSLETLPIAIEVFDLWHEIRKHPAYAFGTLFTQPDFDRGVPPGFDHREIEEMLAVTGRAYIESKYQGETAFHRLAHRFRPSRRRKKLAARCPVVPIER